jgi:hypothetical protein
MGYAIYYIICVAAGAGVYYFIGRGIYRAATKGEREKKLAEETKKQEALELEEREKAEKIEREKLHYKNTHYIGGDKIIQHEIIKIHGGKGRGDELLKNIGRRVEEANFPNKPTCSTETMVFDIRGQQTQPFLVFENGTEAVKAWRMYVGAADWGDLLDVSWYLMEEITEVPWRPTDNGKFPRTSWENREIENFAGTIAAIVSSETENLKSEIALGFSMNGSNKTL